MTNEQAREVKVDRFNLLTLPANTPADLTVTVTTDSPDDSFFVTYPVISGYNTEVMNHVPGSFNHTATVTLHSGRRFELLTVQGFKSQAFKDTLFSETTASRIQSAVVAFR